MTHSVQKHLSVSPAAYDVEIRRFIPGYDAMLEEVAFALVDAGGAQARRVDLGAGTGSLTDRVARTLLDAHFTLIDIDPAMLAQASKRLEAVRERVDALRAIVRRPSAAV